MEVRIAPLRVAMAALFVLAGVGLRSLVSPLVGNALATVGTLASISDPSVHQRPDSGLAEDGDKLFRGPSAVSDGKNSHLVLTIVPFLVLERCVWQRL